MSADVTSGRTTFYKGIKMRSRLEADYAGSLDRRSAVWNYEPKCFAGPDGQWLPDFAVNVRDRPTRYVELKPMPESGELDVAYVDSLIEKMQVAWLSEPDADLNLVFWRWGDGAGVVLSSAGSFRAWFVDAGVGRHLWPSLRQTCLIAAGPMIESACARAEKMVTKLMWEQLDGWRRESQLLALLERPGNEALLGEALSLVGAPKPGVDGGGSEAFDLPPSVREVRERDRRIEESERELRAYCAANGLPFDRPAPAEQAA